MLQLLYNPSIVVFTFFDVSKQFRGLAMTANIPIAYIGCLHGSLMTHVKTNTCETLKDEGFTRILTATRWKEE